MSVTVPIRAIELTPGNTVTIPNLSWQEFELVLAELGEPRSNRINQLKIYDLSDDRYTESPTSPIFPDLPIEDLIPTLMQKVIDEGTSKMLWELKTQLCKVVLPKKDDH